MTFNKNKGKIAFLNSPYILNEPFYQHMPPLSLLYLSSYVEKNGFEPRIYNLEKVHKDKGIYYFGFDIQKVLKDLSVFKPDIIGITCPYSSRWPYTQRLIKIIKSKFKDIPVVIGGIHPTTFPKHCLSSSGADYLIIGEGEFTTVELFKHILADTKPYKIDGIAFQNGNKFIHNPKTKFISNLDELPFPAYHCIDMERYKKICKKDRISQFKGLYFSLLTSRSCPNQCTYCNMHLAHGRKWRPRSPENVISEISYLINKYGVRQFAIMDDNFLILKDRALAILKEIIKRRMNIKLITPNGLSIKTLDDEIVWHLKKAGALEISVAIESGSEHIRNSVYNKGLSTEQILKTINSCKKYKLPCKAFFMVGAPGESDNTIKKSLKLMRKIKIPAYINITTPYKGTKLYDLYIEKKIVKEEDLKEGNSIDIRLPPEKMKNYDKIISWKKKMQIFNILYSWQEILKNPGLFNINALNRLIAGVFFTNKLTKDNINSILDKYLPLPTKG